LSCEAEKVTGYVDGALPPDERVRVEEHLQACAECRTQVEGERALRARLSALPAPEPPDTLAARVSRGLLRARRPSRLRWALPLAAALALFAFWAHTAPGVVAMQMAWDHDHCFAHQTLPAKVWTADAGFMAGWLERHGTEPPSLPDEAGGLELVGGRYCGVGNRRLAHVYYTGGQRHLSLYVVPGWVRGERARAWRRGDKTVRLLHTGGATVGLVSEQTELVDAFERALTTTYARRVAHLLAARLPD
jgi:anti-sigma factor RsiW